MNCSDEWVVGPDEPHLGKKKECELIEEDGEGLGLILALIVDEGMIPEVFYAKDNRTEDDIELKTCDYLDGTFIAWYNNKSEFDEYREFTIEELTRVVKGGLSLDELIIAVRAAVEEHGEDIAGYVDPDDLYLSSELSQKIVEHGREALWDEVSDWNIDSDDSYYDTHKDFIVDFLKLTESEQDEYKDELMDMLREHIYVSYDYDGALDCTEVRLNVAYIKDWEYVYGWQYIDYKNNKIVSMPEEYGAVLALFGYTLEGYIDWYNSDSRSEHKFYESFEAEIDNSGQGFTEIVFLLKMSLNDVLKLKDADALVLGTNVRYGMFDHWNGGGSPLELNSDTEVTLDPKSKHVSWRVDGQDGNYDVDAVYGLCGDAWSTDFKIEMAEESLGSSGKVEK